MKNKKILTIILSILTVCSAAGCSQNGNEQTTDVQAAENSEADKHATVSTVTLTEGKYSEEKLDDTWDENRAVYLTLEDDKISVDEADRVETDERTVTIKQEGTYVFSGSMEDGQILVDADKDAVIRLVFNGVRLKCSGSAPVYSKGGNVIITLVDGTENVFEDSDQYVYEEEGQDEPDAAIFAKDDLTFNGTGTLKVTGNYNHGIHCKDALKFVTGTYMISAVDDGIVGKDSVSVKNGNFTIESGDDGIKSTNTEETDKGYVLIEDGSFQITAGGDGIQAETLLRVNNGNMEIVTGDGSSSAERASDTPEEMRGGHPGMQEKTGQERMRGDRQGEPSGEMTEGRIRPSEEDMREKAGGEETTPPEGMPEGTADERMTPQEGMPEGTADERMAPQERMPEGTADERMAPRERTPGEPADAEMVSPEEAQESDTVSTKALKSYVEVIIAGGEFVIDSCDDAVHSDQNVTIEGGTFTIQTGDDGVHADQKLTVNDGEMNILESYEGLESAEITINGGEIRITASDDGINAASDNDSASNPEANDPEANDLEADDPKQFQGKRGSFMAGEDQGAVMTFNGGTVYVNANGDGLDANGDIFINGGDITVHGPENGGNGTLDYASACKITGGTFIGVGSAGMAQNPGEDSTQPVIVWSMNEAVEAGTIISVKDRNGEVVAETTAEKKVQWAAVSSPELAIGESYTICVGNNEKLIELSQIITDDVVF